MSSLSPALSVIALDCLMIIYTLWVLSQRPATAGRGAIIAAVLFAWLGLLHLGLSGEQLFPADISGIAFLLLIFAAVGLVGALLLGLPASRRLLLAMDQQQLLLFQGIRVFFGAGFLMQAALGSLPTGFGIIDGLSHIAAGFFGLVAAFSLASSSLASGTSGERRAWFANLFGLFDILIVASSLALILLPQIGVHHAMMYAVFLPAPLWLWAHLISIAGLLRTGQAQTGLAQKAG